MTAQKGSLVLIQIGNGGGSETFTTIGGLKTSQMALNNQALDASNISSDWKMLLGNVGIKSLSISGTGTFTDAASEETLRGYAFSGSVNNYRFVFANGDYFTGAFQVSSYERSGNHDGEETYAIALHSAGVVNYTVV